MADKLNLIKKLGFIPKENTSGIYHKKYSTCNDYSIEIDFDKNKINYGKRIKSESKTTQNFSQEENWVVLECVNRLLEKGYQPQNIILEKTWATGHGTSGRLDILVAKNNGTAYLMIECKNWGSEFDKEFNNLKKNGGQLFTYFQQDKDADVLMLYASEFNGREINYRNEIVKVEDDYRQTGNVKDFFDRWNKLPKTNGIFDSWVFPYEFQSKALTKKDLKVLKQEDSSFIFNRFLEILRHNVVSDKPNAFNKIFTLFLCKIIDEDRSDNEQLHFQWIEGEDDNISFQKRLTDLYNRGMLELLEKKVTDVSDAEFDKQFQQVEEQYKEKFKDLLTEIRLKKNNEFAIKEVYDDDSFQENAKVVKEVVELLQDYRIRYNYRQQFLSDFFELLLTTGLKQESGQFFTPVPVVRFITRSIPIQEITAKKLKEGNKNNLLPVVIDYAGGSGHFITEAMEEIQSFIESQNKRGLNPTTLKALKKWKEDPFDWAEDYIYAIEKDYRLVKTTKVSCYLHGDGLAKVIHGDGLADFATDKDYKDKLKVTNKTYNQDNKQFDIVISNPPYSVSAFKGMLVEEQAKCNFDLYKRLTDQSSEIECLFIERTKQLLKDGGVAGIILPSSILSNTGIYTETREILFKYFEIIAIAELGSNTFMATGTNTVTLFLKRRNNADWLNIQASVNKFTTNFQDITINGIEKPVSKYIAHAWEDISFEDYISLIQKQPNDGILEHEIYQEYTKNIKAKTKQERWNKIIELEQEKLLYFVLAYPQKVVLIKTGEKKEEKQFLGYEFSNRRGSEGIHPIQRGKTIDECTSLFDPNVFDNSEKASTYIYKAFQGDFNFEIAKKVQKNVSRIDLIDMMTFDRIDFEKTISLSVKKKIKIESRWNLVKIGDICTTSSGGTPLSGTPEYYNNGNILWINSGEVREGIILNSQNKITEIGLKKSSAKIFPKHTVLIAMYGATAGQVGILGVEASTNQAVCGILPNEKILPFYLFNFFKTQYDNLLSLRSGVARLNISQDVIREFKIPFPPKEIQEKIVAEIEVLEAKENKAVDKIEELKGKIRSYLQSKNKIMFKGVLETINPSKNDVISKYQDDAIVSFLSMSDVSNEGQIINLQKRILKDVKTGFTFFQEEDVLFAKITPCMENGKGALISKLENNIGFGSTEFFVLRANKNKILPKILFYFIQSKEFRKNAEKVMTGASGHRRVPKSFIETYEIPLLTLKEQKQIVIEVEKIENKIEKLENEIESIPQERERVLKEYL